MFLKRINNFLNNSIVYRVTTSRELLKQHLQTPLYRNAYYLIVSALVTAVLGFVFWVVAARLYSPEDVGLASATISAIILLASFSTLGLGYGLIRFIPNAGPRSIPMINSSLTIAALVSILVGSVFLVGLNFWSPALNFILEQPLYIAVFLLFTLFWALFTITDEVFISKRTSKYTLLKNIVANVTKIPLLYLPAIIVGTFTIITSAGLGMAVGTLIAMLWFLPKVLKGYLPIPTLRIGTLKAIIQYSLGNYVALLVWGLPAMIYPLLVVNVLGAEANAYFYIAWAIASMVFMIPHALSFSLFAEGSHNEETLPSNIKKSLKLSIAILLPVILVVCLIASTLLLFFGEGYSQNAEALVVVLVLSTIPLTVNYLYITANRVTKNIKRVISVSSVIALLCLCLSYFLMLELDIVGVGLGYVIGQSVVAIIVLIPLLRQRVKINETNK